MWANIEILLIAPQFAVGLLLEGLLIGAVFALVAYGLALVWGVMNVKNLAQGPFVITGGYVCWYLATLGIHPLIGIFGSIIVLWLLSWVTFKFIVSKVLEQDMFVSLLATFGMAYVLEQSLSLIFTQDTQTINLGWASVSLFDGAVLLAGQKILAFVIACILAIVLVVFMKRSRMGQAIRATAQNARAARVMGIDTDKVYSFTFCLNGAICGAAGALVAMIWVIQPFYGITYSIRAFVIVTAAGLGNLPGVITAGLGMGSLEQFGGFILGAEYQQALVVGMLLLVLAIRLWQQSRKRQAVV
ncbi:MAG: branched-chain amino acid ABC transporter permease [Pikeienuella sp.]